MASFYSRQPRENYTRVRQIRSNKGEMSWRNVREIKRILRAAELVRGDRSERTGPLRGGSSLQYEMTFINESKDVDVGQLKKLKRIQKAVAMRQLSPPGTNGSLSLGLRAARKAQNSTTKLFLSRVEAT
ncbi:hypothetical protein EYF80_020623 [Liparis tanakae]|uniref:Uncharacterized protein n=1 Tax=Liparis tanakae TaxID=230148 RepID=A0A4Z2HTH7_9TELE|nr:hypothetical protein EYF80_020623 [Liparis tanakae]